MIWVNPLLRWGRFEQLAKGMQAMLPHVDVLRAGHSVASLEALDRHCRAAAAGRPGG